MFNTFKLQLFTQIFILSQQLTRQYFRQTTVTQQKLIQDMDSRIMTRAQRRLAKYNHVQPKPLKQIASNTKEDQSQKQDHLKNENITTCHKIEEDKQNPRKLKPITILNNNSTNERFHRYRKKMVKCFSQLQYCYKTSMQALFLAAAIFDKYTDYVEKNSLFLEDKLLAIAIISFRIAIKVQQIYPPSLQQIYRKLNTIIDLGDFIEIQTDILVKLQFNLAFPSPLTELESFSFQMTQQKRNFIYLYLEIALSNLNIVKNYSWSEVIDAIKLMFQPANMIPREEKRNSKKLDCLKFLITQRGKVYDCYNWLYSKYSLQDTCQVRNIDFFSKND